MLFRIGGRRTLPRSRAAATALNLTRVGRLEIEAGAASRRPDLNRTVSFPPKRRRNRPHNWRVPESYTHGLLGSRLGPIMYTMRQKHMWNLGSGKRGEAEIGSPHTQWRRSAWQRFRSAASRTEGHRTHGSGAQTAECRTPEQQNSRAAEPQSRRTHGSGAHAAECKTGEYGLCFA